MLETSASHEKDHVRNANTDSPTAMQKAASDAYQPQSNHLCSGWKKELGASGSDHIVFTDLWGSKGSHKSITDQSIAHVSDKVGGTTIAGGKVDVQHHSHHKHHGEHALGAEKPTPLPGTDIPPVAVPGIGADTPILPANPGTNSASDSIFKQYGLPPIPEVALKPGTGHIYYVDASAQNAGNGGQKSPFKTIQEAADAVHAGDTVMVAPGVYGPVNVHASGTADNRIKFISTQQGGAEIHGNYNQWIFKATGDNVSVIGFNVNGQNAARGGIEMAGANAQVIGNDVHNILPFNDGSGGASIDLAGYLDKSGKIIEGGVVYGNAIHDSGVVGQGGSSAGHGIYVANKGAKVFNNVLKNLSGYPLHNWHADTHDTFENNFVGESAHGFVMGNGDGPFNGGPDPTTGEVGPSNMVVTRNIFENNLGTVVRGLGTVGDHNAVNNNLMVGNTGPDVSVNNPAGTAVFGNIHDQSLAAKNQIGPGYIDPELLKLIQ